MLKTLMQPSEPMREYMARYVPKSTITTQRVARVLDRVEQVDGLARLLEQALVQSTSASGGLDLQRMAMIVRGVLVAHQRTPCPAPAVINATEHAEQIAELATLIDRALEHASAGSGNLDFRKMAVFMLDPENNT